MRSSDLNRLRKLRYGQAVLLGVVIERREVNQWTGRRLWYRTMPNTYHGGGYINGPFQTRHEAVNTALRLLGVISSAGFDTPDAASGDTVTVNFASGALSPQQD